MFSVRNSVGYVDEKMMKKFEEMFGENFEVRVDVFVEDEEEMKRKLEEIENSVGDGSVVWTYRGE